MKLPLVFVGIDESVKNIDIHWFMTREGYWCARVEFNETRGYFRTVERDLATAMRMLAVQLAATR